MTTQRLSTLDGFRAVAVLPVIFFHFFSKWTPPLTTTDLYPYGNAYSTIPLFRYGYLGVEFFFVISGFVIAMTLATSTGPLEFLIKRLSRLWPAMWLCSALTYIVLRCVPHPPFTTQAINFVPSVLFFDPYLLDKFFKADLAWMDGAYWSLFVEVRFYVLAAMVYFLARARFLELFLALSTAVLLLSLAATEASLPNVRIALEILFGLTYLPWFTIGIGFYYLHVNKGVGRFAHFAIVESVAVLGLQLWLARQAPSSAQSSPGMMLAVAVAVSAVFYAFIYKPRWVSIFGWWPISAIGAASYSLYLLHQFAGLTLLRYLTERSGAPGELVAGMVILFLIGVSGFVYRYWETPGKHLMLRLLLSRRAPADAADLGHGQQLGASTSSLPAN